jgi:hypothetical protein
MLPLIPEKLPVLKGAGAHRGGSSRHGCAPGGALELYPAPGNAGANFDRLFSENAGHGLTNEIIAAGQAS